MAGKNGRGPVRRNPRRREPCKSKRCREVAAPTQGGDEFGSGFLPLTWILVQQAGDEFPISLPGGPLPIHGKSRRIRRIRRIAPHVTHVQHEDTYQTENGNDR